jgi:carbon-monoxide dehydrogenase medium subunit
MKPAPFDYVRPDSLAEALKLLATLDGAKVLAGGQSLVPMLNMRFVQPEHIIDVNRLGLDGIRLDGDMLCIGATTRQRDLEFSPLVEAHAPLIVEALKNVGHVQTRNRGTIGGSLCHLDPSAELPTVCMTMDAEIAVQSAARGPRTIAMRQFPLGFMTTAVESDELLTEIRMKVWPRGHGFALEEFARRRGDFAIASAAVMVSLANGQIERAAITIGGVALVPTRIDEAERLLVGARVSDLKIEQAAAFCSQLDASSDCHASSDYRRHLAVEMASRAIRRAIERAERAVS